jgi:hypothetical protein
MVPIHEWSRSTMRKSTATVDISHLPDLLRLAEDVRNTGEPRLLVRGDEEVALLTPVASSRARRKPAPKRKPHHAVNNVFGNIIGIADSGGPGDVSENKYRYLADAYAPPQSE